MHRFANPTQFMRIANAIYPWAAGLAIVLFIIALPIALVTSPADYQQGETVRILYMHVPAAVMAEMIYYAMAAGSAASRRAWPAVRKSRTADSFASARSQRSVQSGAGAGLLRSSRWRRKPARWCCRACRPSAAAQV